MTIPSNDDYFLSSANPVANRDQLEAEECALRLFSTAALQDAVQRVGFLWSLAHGENVPDQAKGAFEQAMAEYAFNYLLKGVASDGNYPRPVRLFMPPHEWSGRSVPGSRMGGDNPDNCYRVIGIYPGARYEVEGHVAGKAAASTTFTLVANYGTSKTIQTVDYEDLRKEEDGSFTLVIDDRPADGRINHLRSGPEVKFLFIRDSMQDWSGESPLALRVRRLDAPTAPPISETEMAERAIKAMTDEVPLYYWFTRLFTGRPVNTMTTPQVSGAVGGLVTQAGSQGWFHLEDDDAWVIKVAPAGARYHGFVVHDWWFRSLDCHKRQSSLTGAMMTPDADGGYTFVLSLKDPGIHNWIDPCGVRDVLTLFRWQGLPQGREAGEPRLELTHATVSGLDDVLPDSAVRVTPEERDRQRSKRVEAFARRLVDR